jgi:hypothetical protein
MWTLQLFTLPTAILADILKKLRKTAGSRFRSPNENTAYNLTLYFTESYAVTFIIVDSYFIIMALQAILLIKKTLRKFHS